MENNQPGRKIHPLSIVGALLLAAAIVGLAFLYFRMSSANSQVAEQTPVFNITLNPAPTPTEIFILPTDLPTPTSDAPVILPSGAVGVGVYIKVTGTSGLGLNIRADAGRGSTVQFLAMDEEVFKVIGGPVVADGYTWWQLEAPYEAGRTGWAAETYLQILDISTQTP